MSGLIQDIDNTRDAALLRRISEDDEAAFAELFTLYRDRLFLFLSGMLQSDEVAEELVLDVFMKIWTGRDTLIEIRDFRAFIFRVARNKAIDFFRASAHDRQLRAALSDRLQISDDRSADEALRVKEYEKYLREAIDLLPRQRQRAYLLSQEGLSWQQIAGEMQISEASVNTHLTEARRFIRLHLSRNMDLALVLVLFCDQVSQMQSSHML